MCVWREGGVTSSVSVCQSFSLASALQGFTPYLGHQMVKELNSSGSLVQTKKERFQLQQMMCVAYILHDTHIQLLITTVFCKGVYTNVGSIIYIKKS